MSKKNRGLNFYADNYWQSANWNRRSFEMYRQQIMSLALARFKWVGLPETCDARFLEQNLLLYGVATIAYPKSQPGVFYSTKAITQSRLTVYDNPARWRSFGNNGWQFNVTPQNGVLVYDNLQRLPLLSQIELYARRLANYDRVIDINLQQQKTPFVITGDKTQEQDIINMYKQIAGGEPAILGLNGLSSINVTAINTQVPYIANQIETSKLNCWNEIYNLLGIENLTRKAERMVQDEVNANSEPTKLAALDPLTARREACEKLNKRFGLDIHVIWRQDNESDNYNYLNNLEKQEEVGE